MSLWMWSVDVVRKKTRLHLDQEKVVGVSQVGSVPRYPDDCRPNKPMRALKKIVLAGPSSTGTRRLDAQRTLVAEEAEGRSRMDTRQLDGWTKMGAGDGVH